MRKRESPAKRILAVILVFVAVVAVLSAAAYIVYEMYFKPNDQVVPAFEEGVLNLVVEGTQVRTKVEPRIVEEAVYLPLDVIKEYIDPDINWDEELHKLTITTRNRVIRMKTDSLEAFVNNEPVNLNFPVEEVDGNVFVPIEFLSDFYGIEVTYVPENSVIMIDFKNRVRQIATPISPEAVLRVDRSVRSPMVKDADSLKDTELRVFEEYDDWYKVRTEDGIIGYIEKRYVMVKLVTVLEGFPDDAYTEAWKPDKGKINLVWDYWSRRNNKYASRGKIPGLDVISPTWFQVSDEKGNISNIADAKYVEWAHKNGYKVWALFSNNFSDAGQSSAFLRNTDARDNSIRQILAFASLYKIDGINIDFENLNANDKDALTQYVREITPLLREQGLVVSICVNNLPCYDRKALGETVDYVMLMAYDQHWKGGGKAGSVAELGWTERTLRNYLNSVPAEKLLLGMPFYTRLWTEEKAEDGSIKLTSQALSMEAAKKAVTDNNAEVRWDETSGQFYAEYEKNGGRFRVWLEDANSINLRTGLVHKYSLAGAAAWRLDFETPDIWEVINGNLKDIGGYTQWKLANADSSYTYK